MALRKTLYNATAAGANKYEIIQLRNDFRRLDVSSYWLASGKSQFSEHLFFRSFGAFYCQYLFIRNIRIVYLEDDLVQLFHHHNSQCIRACDSRAAGGSILHSC